MAENPSLLVLSDDSALLEVAARLSVPPPSTAGQPAVVLLDADQLGGTLAGKVAELRDRYPQAALLVVGASGAPQRIVDAMRSGAADWLSRPVSPDLLMVRVDAALAREALARERRSVLSSLERLGRSVEEDRRDLASHIVAMDEELERVHSQLDAAHQQLHARVSQLAMLYRIGRDLSIDRNWDEALGRLLESLRSFLGALGAGLLLTSEGGRRLAPRRVDGLAPELVQLAQRRLATIATSDQIAGQEPRATSGPDAPFPLESVHEGRWTPCADQTSAWEVTVLPLRHRQRALGYFLLRKPYHGTDDIAADLHFLTTIQTILAEEVAGAQALFELRRLQSFQEQTLDHVGSGIVVLSPEGDVLYANRKAQELAGDGWSVATLGARLRVGPEGEPLASWLADREAMAAAEGWLDQGTDRAPIPVGVRASQLPGETAQQRSIAVILDDQRATRQLEAERRRAARQDELLVMAAEWAHDVRTPLTGILHNAELLAEPQASTADRERRFQVIQGEVGRINDLVSNFLDFARPVRLRLALQGVHALAQAATSLMQARAKQRGVVLVLEVGSGAAAQALVDAAKLEQVMLNLIENAIDASPKQGTVTVRVDIDPASGALLDAPATDGALVICVQDEGHGVAPEHLPRLFIPFFTTKSTGCGLGLAISEKIVREHHGVLRYERRESRTLMRVVLPSHGLSTAPPTSFQARG